MPLSIAMWSGPRNVSTALMRSFESRSDTAVCDEPLYAHYLKATGAPHPGREEVIALHESDWRVVARQLAGPVPGGKAVFYQKHMAHHLLPAIERDWLWGLEHAFLPPLLEVASNPKILPTGPAYIDASVYVQPLEVPSSQNRSQGELHPLGNPHFNLDPVQGKRMARAIAEGLARVDPAGATAYQEGLRRYTALLDQKIGEWEKLAAPLRGVSGG